MESQAEAQTVPTFVPTWIKLQLKGQHVLGRLGQRLNWVNGNLFYTECSDRNTKVEVFMIFTTTWECMKIAPYSATGAATPMPGYRFLYTCTTCGNDLVLVGGTDSRKTRLNEVWVFNTMTKEWRALPREGNQMPGRESHSSTLLDNKLYIFGGNGNPDTSQRPKTGSTEDMKYLNDMWCLDLATDTIMQVGVGDVGPQPRTNHAAAVVGSNIIIFGGDCGDKYLEDVWSFNTLTQTWSLLSVASSWTPGPRAAHSAIGIGDNAVLVYGGVDNAATVSEAVWILYVGPGSHHNLSEGEAHWEMLQVVGMLPVGRFAHTSDYGDGCFFISGGFNNGDQRMEDLYVLTLTEPAKTSMMLGCAQQSSTAATPPTTKTQATKRFDPGPRKVTSYNVYCTEVRDNLRMQHPEASARDIEKMIGQQWANMTAEQKREYEEKARITNAQSMAMHNAGIKMDDGRTSSGGYKKMRVDKHPGLSNSMPPPPPETTFQLFTPNPSLIGSNVEGKIDAVFNAGYLATVKCNGFTYRALLFSPYLALSVPLSVQPAQGMGSQDPNMHLSLQQQHLHPQQHPQQQASVLGLPQLSQAGAQPHMMASAATPSGPPRM